MEWETKEAIKKGALVGLLCIIAVVLLFGFGIVDLFIEITKFIWYDILNMGERPLGFIVLNYLVTY